MKYKEYCITLPLSKKIYGMLYKSPVTSKEIADKYNKIADINRILINEK